MSRLLLTSLVAAIPSFAADAYLPLFLIERSQNTNVVHYDAKITGGKLDPKQPVVAYWIMVAEKGQRQELNLLERKEAYGFSVEADGSPDGFAIKIVSDPHRAIHIELKEGAAKAETTIGGHPAYLQKIFITTRKKLTINVAVSAELYGTDVMTGESRYEKVLH